MPSCINISNKNNIDDNVMEREEKKENRTTKTQKKMEKTKQEMQ